MKKVLLSSTVVAMLLLSGCSDKQPAIDASSNAASTTSGSENGQSNTESVAADNAVVTDENVESSSANNGSGEVDNSMSGIEKRMQTVNFDFDKFNLTPQMQSKVESNAKLANSVAADYMIKLEGNCDEWGSDEYNFALGLKRAKSVKNEMVANGVDAKRISMVSYGESNPVCTDKTQACWAKNRRVDVKLLP